MSDLLNLYFNSELSSLRLKENGTSVTELCKKQKISRATFYNWMTMLRIEALEKENKALKRELLRLKPKKRTSITPSELKTSNSSNNLEFFETVATVMADIILSDNNYNLEELLSKLKSK